MKHIVSLWRLTLRHILTALLGVVAFLSGSCSWIINTPVEYGPPAPEYGPPPQQRISISGTVKYNENPVPGFWVSVLWENSSGPDTRTDINGSFELSVNKRGSSYTLSFQDVDGPQNGEFKSQTVQWHYGDDPLNIVLEPKGPMIQ
jgi:putative lipoprotein (rSAM/lipoprotein system)